MALGDKAGIDDQPSRDDGKVVRATEVFATAQLSNPQPPAVGPVGAIDLFQLDDAIGERLTSQVLFRRCSLIQHYGRDGARSHKVTHALELASVEGGRRGQNAKAGNRVEHQ